MSEERNIWPVFDNAHTESVQVSDLPLANERGASPKDGTVEILCSGEAGFKSIDAGH
jgi:hypothetical protein